MKLLFSRGLLRGVLLRDHSYIMATSANTQKVQWASIPREIKLLQPVYNRIAIYASTMGHLKMHEYVLARK